MVTQLRLSWECAALSCKSYYSNSHSSCAEYSQYFASLYGRSFHLSSGTLDMLRQKETPLRGPVTPYIPSGPRTCKNGPNEESQRLVCGSLRSASSSQDEGSMSIPSGPRSRGNGQNEESPGFVCGSLRTASSSQDEGSTSIPSGPRSYGNG